MANNPELVKALSSLPDDVKARLSKGTPEQKKIFIDGLAKRLELQSDVSSQSLEKKPTFGSELGRVALQGASGLAFDIPNIGRKPISEIVGGQPLSYMNRAARLAQDPRAAFGSFLTSGPQGFADRLNNVRESTPADFGFPVLPEPQTKLGKIAGVMANLGGQALAAKGISKIGGIKPNMEISVNSLAREKQIDDFVSSIYKAKGDASKAFGKALDDLVIKNPTKRVDVSRIVGDLNAEAGFDARLKTALERSPKLKGLLDGDIDPQKVKVNDIQEIINDFKSANKSAFNPGNTDPFARDIRSIVQDLKHSQSSAFPEMKEPNAAYARVAEDFKIIKGKLRGDSPEIFIKGGFGDTKSQNAIKRLLKNNPDVYKTAKNIKSSDAFKDYLKNDLVKAGAYTAGGAFIYDFIKKMKGN